MIEALADLWEEVIMCVSAGVLRIHLVIVPFAGRGRIVAGVNMFSARWTLVLIIWGIGVPVLYAVDLRIGAMIDVLEWEVIDVAPGSGVGGPAGVGDNMSAAIKTAWEFMIMLPSSEEFLVFNWETFSFWTTAV